MTEPQWRRFGQRACPAVAWIDPHNYPHCDLVRSHEGPHVAERGLGADITWTEQWT